LSINALYQQAVDGDKSAENQLFELLTVRLRLFAYQRVGDEDVAHEVVQDALTIILDKYRRVGIHSSFAAWAHQILKNVIFNHARTQIRRKRIMESQPADVDSAAAPNVSPGFERSLIDCLRKIAQTNPRYARVLNLKYQGYTVNEICERLEMSSANLYVTLLRARKALAHCLDKEDEK